MADIQLDMDTFTIGEVELIERLSGLPFSKLGAALQGELDVPTGGVLKALALVALRRQNPDATEEDAANVRFDELFAGAIAKAASDEHKEGITLPPPSPPTNER
jgi:hypothetical protein